MFRIEVAEPDLSIIDREHECIQFKTIVLL